MTPEDFNPDYLIPGTRVGAYVVRDQLGHGSGSVAYLMESPSGRKVVLKMSLYPRKGNPEDADMHERFLRQVDYLFQLRGAPGVAEILGQDYYPDPLYGFPYFVQEWVPGKTTIIDWVSSPQPLGKLILSWTLLAATCGEMGSKHICHRDLVPDNILVTPQGVPKIVDFSSAIGLGAQRLTATGAEYVPGQYDSYSPERCLAILRERATGKQEPYEYRPTDDLHALGAIFYQVLTGEHPFDVPDDSDESLQLIAHATPILPSKRNAGVPWAMEKVTARLLLKNPAQRYQSGFEVAEELDAFVKNIREDWSRPFQMPRPDRHSLVLVPPQVPTPEPVPVNEKQSEGPMPDTPHSKPHSVDTGTPADAESSCEATSSPQSARPDASSPPTADTDVVLLDEMETAEPRGLLPESEPAVGTVLDFGEAGAYTLEQRLGRGGMGEVYLARQVGAAGFVQSVAIKRVRPGGRQWEARAFVDEARVLSRLHHPNIARVYAFLEKEGSYYLVMEYIEGHSLHTLLELANRKGHRFSESVACAVMAEVADALHYAHHVTDEAVRPLQIVHRDVSPTNILITKTGRVVLVDFGVALFKHEERAATPAGFTFIKGKAPYVSPEQVKRLPLDARSDLFSVGTILMEMLTGKAPFGWAADFLTLKRIETVTPEYVASLLPGVSAPLRALCQKLLAHHPDQRFATGCEVAKALRHHAGLSEDAQSIQAEVERLQALPDVKAPTPPVAEAVVRSLSGVKRARRTLALASALMLAATLTLFFWHVPREAVPVPSSAPLPGPAVSLSRPPEKSIAQAPPVPQPSPLVCKPNKEDGPAVAAGPARRRRVAAAPPSGALPLASADKKTRDPVTAPPAERRTAEVVRVSPDSDEATGTLRDEPLAAQGQAASNVKASGEVLSVDHALAALLVQGRVDLTPFRTFDTWWLHEDGADVEVSILTPKKDKSEADEGKVAVVLNVTNRSLALPWRLQEIRLTTATGERPWPFAVRSDGESISRGQSGKVAIVMDVSTFDRTKDGEELVLDVLRTGGYRQVSTALAVRELIHR